MTWMRGRFRASGDDGLTLVELLVTIVMFGIIGSVVSIAMIATQKTSRNVGVRAQDLSNVQVAVEDMTKLLRTASVRPTTGTPDLALETAGPNSITFYGYNLPGAAPSKISFYVDTSNKLWESVATANQCTSVLPSDWTYGTPRVRMLASSVNVGTTLFTYHVAPVASPAPTSYAGATLVPSGTPPTIAAAQLGSIDSVEINLNVDLPTSPDIPSASVTTQVNLPNQLVAAENVPESAC